MAWSSGTPRRPAFVLRVGVGPPAFRPRAPWVMLGAYTGTTAHSPGNLAAHQRLGAVLAKSSSRCWEGQGFGEDGSGVAEQMWLAEGITLGEALQLGREYGQLAVLVGTPDGTPRLVLSRTGEDVSDDVPRPELPVVSIQGFARRMGLISCAMERAGFEVLAASVGRPVRGRRRTHEEAVPDEAWTIARDFDGAEFAWRAPAEPTALAGRLRVSTVREMEADAGASESGAASFRWLRAADVSFSFLSEDGHTEFVGLDPDGISVCEGISTLQVLNTCLDHLAIAGWELAVPQAYGATKERKRLLEQCRGQARETWARMGLPPPASLDVA